MNPVSEALATKRVLICLGAGGVGKTTVSASLALRASLAGRSAIVCTIDPAKRLANALGLSELGNAETRISDDVLRAAGLEPRAPLRAMMLDMKQAWDEMVIRLAPPASRERILSNRLYRSLSTALAGSQEYIAVEKLLELRRDRDYGLVVLDTPPTAQALDFLEAPNRVLDFLDNEAAKWLLTPALLAGKVGLQLFNLGGSYVTKTLAKLTGVELLEELANFLLAMSSMNEGMRNTARDVRELLSAEETGFVLVTGTARERLDEVVHLHRLLAQHGMRTVAIAVNRVHSRPDASLKERAERLTDVGLREKLLKTLSEREALADADEAGMAELEKTCSPVPLVPIPRFDVDVHDLAALARTAGFLAQEEQI